MKGTFFRMMRSGVVNGVWIMAFLACLPLARAEEPDDARILERILGTRDALLKATALTNSDRWPVFIAAWDFDGTILKGDCSEGLKVEGRTVYPGLAEVSIEMGLSQIYPHDGGFEKFWTNYTNMDTSIGHWLAYPFIPQMLRGAKADEVLRLSRLQFSNVMSNYLMASSVKIIRTLQAQGIESHIISASADLFVKGAGPSLGIPEERIHGIEVRVRDGRLTEEIVYPVTWNVGKLERLKKIVAQLEETRHRKVFVLAGFGDSYNTDGPFLKFIASQTLPAGKAIAVFYDRDSPEPEDYKGFFYRAQHTHTVSDKVE
jgi:phosphoserine phosphatase